MGSLVFNNSVSDKAKNTDSMDKDIRLLTTPLL